MTLEFSNNIHTNQKTTEHIKQHEDADVILKIAKRKLNELEAEVSGKESTKISIIPIEGQNILNDLLGVDIVNQSGTEAIHIYNQMRHDITIITPHILQEGLGKNYDDVLNTPSIQAAILGRILHGVSYSQEYILSEKSIQGHAMTTILFPDMPDLGIEKKPKKNEIRPNMGITPNIELSDTIDMIIQDIKFAHLGSQNNQPELSRKETRKRRKDKMATNATQESVLKAVSLKTDGLLKKTSYENKTAFGLEQKDIYDSISGKYNTLIMMESSKLGKKIGSMIENSDTAVDFVNQLLSDKVDIPKFLKPLIKPFISLFMKDKFNNIEKLRPAVKKNGGRDFLKHLTDIPMRKESEILIRKYHNNGTPYRGRGIMSVFHGIDDIKTLNLQQKDIVQSVSYEKIYDTISDRYEEEHMQFDPNILATLTSYQGSKENPNDSDIIIRHQTNDTEQENEKQGGNRTLNPKVSSEVKKEIFVEFVKIKTKEGLKTEKVKDQFLQDEESYVAYLMGSYVQGKYSHYKHFDNA